MALTTSQTLSVNKAMYDTLYHYALVPQLYYDALCEIKSTQNTGRGTSVQFTVTSHLASADTAISESSDITPVAMSDSVVVATPLEFANAVQINAKNEATAFYNLNPILARVVGYNAGLSVDTVAQKKAQVGTNSIFSVGAGSAQTARASIATTNTLDGNAIRRAGAKLSGANVERIGQAWAGLMHPDVSFDFRGTTGGVNWSDPHVYGQDQSDLWNGFVGRFQGVQFIETPRAPLFVDGSANGTANAKTTSGSTASDANNSVTITTTAAHLMSVGQGITFSANGGVGLPATAVIVSVPSTTTFTITQAGVSAGAPAVTVTSGSVDVYGTLILGREALGKAFSTGGGYSADPVMGEIPVIDVAKRFTGLYWKHFVDYIIFRQAAIYRIESSSSIGAN